MFKPEFPDSETCSGQTPLSNKAILIVDDDPVFRRIASGYLQSQGCTVHEAEDGLVGLRQLREQCPDLVICDISMPVLNGLEFVEEVSLAYPCLPMIVISATDEMSDVARALKHGIKDFLSKPINDYSHLGQAIANALSDTHSHVSDQRDFSSQWFQVEDGGDIPEEQELYWHLEYLQQNLSAARELLNALLPENDTSQGIWRCSYRLLQSAETMPLVFDYAWLMNGQYAFYIVDSGSQSCDGIATTLLIRALFHDYLRGLKSMGADLKDLADILEKGINCTECACSISAMIGIADLSDGTLSVLPAGMDCFWNNGQNSQHIAGGVSLGDNCRKNFITQNLPLRESSEISVSRLGVSSFSLNISQKTES
ncbi:Regulator of RpoS [Vibrio ruber DSM 16370]|uniref:Regulator of RpoS n=1 Tax=Vibrio ruber (strain DSM 16370 / JCM 11486 / BCRC 17186 / CECT 7878 / LMG 23124 / VR1) TaxID=1123498 RepID=A0A1R4LKH2_VIBR1|nr:response regulator [Vibrio ruber]SJN57072.1 Regulator of RpoS [Vibrio ruber DSM 16370]